MDDLKVMAEGGVEEQLLEPKETTDHTGKRWLKVGAGLLVVGVAIHFLLKVFLLVLLSENFLEFLDWCGNNPWLGAFLYSLIFSLGAVLCLPEIALAAVSGYLFPYYLAFLATWVGGVVGASLSFLIGRYVRTGCTKCLFKGKSKFLEELNNVIVRRRWKGVLLVRLPYIPFVLVNYGLATTTISYSDYLWPTVVGLAPGSALFTYIGMSVKSIKSVLDGSESLGTLPIVLSIVGFLFFTGMFIYVGYLAKKSIKARSHSDSEDSLCSDEDPSRPLIKKLSAGNSFRETVG